MCLIFFSQYTLDTKSLFHPRCHRHLVTACANYRNRLETMGSLLELQAGQLESRRCWWEKILLGVPQLSALLLSKSFWHTAT